LNNALVTGEKWHFKGHMFMVKHRKSTYPKQKIWAHNPSVGKRQL